MVLKDMSYMYPIYPIIGSITVLLCLFPIPAHWRAGNIATISLALWTSIGIFITVIDVCVWHGNIRNPYPIWGDIVQVYLAMLPAAIASCTLCIQYRLWAIARAKSVFVTKKDKRRQKYTTYFFCFGIPFLLAVIHYVVQGHRYNVWEDLGPLAETYNVTLAFPVFFMWEPLICAVSGVFSVLTIRLFLARRKEFDAVLNSGSTNINKDRYLRLLSLAAVGVCIHLPLATWNIILNAVAFPVYPWKGWEDTHSNYHRIMYVTRFMISTAPQTAIYASISWWSLILCGVNFFIFFGFGEEATRQYQSMLGACLKPFGIKYPKERKRQTVHKTWLDVILCRPGRPINLTSSFTSSTVPHFASNPTQSQSQSRPSGHGRRAPHPTRTQTTTGSGANDLNIDISNLDFLDPAEAKKQARIAAYSRPGQAIAKSKAAAANANAANNNNANNANDKNGGAKRASMDSSIHRSSLEEEEGSDITDEKNREEDDRSVSVSSPSSSIPAKVEFDLEAQHAHVQAHAAEDPEAVVAALEAAEAAEAALQEQRRREILEKNPELTEEVSF